MSAPLHVHSATPVNNNGAATTGPTITLTGVVAGNEIVVWGTWGSSNTVPSCADDKGNTYVAQTQLFNLGNNQGLSGFVAKVTTGGTVIITVSWGGNADYRTVFAEEKSGVNTTTDIDVTSVGQEQAAPGTGVDGLSTTAFTTVTDDCLICAASVNISDSNIPAVGSVGTSRSSDGGGAAMRSEDWESGSSGAKTSHLTALSNVLHLSAQIALRPVTGGAATERHQTRHMIQAGGFY